MVKTARACCSLALLACGSRSGGPRSVSSLLVGSFGRRSAASAFSRSKLLASSSSSTTSADDTTMSSSDDNVNVAANLESVKERIASSLQGNDDDSSRHVVRLVAVSKTKPIPLLMQAYNAGQRDFGENYVQELVKKATEMPTDISWHYIGPLQSNKANLLVKSVPNLTVETVATMKLANKLNRAVELLEMTEKKPLDIYVQVNTSGEESKSGVSPGTDTVELCRGIVENCPLLKLKGLMTIGAVGDTSCFKVLVDCCKEVEAALNLQDLELSMGMSGDFETAIQHGATSVRVGSTIFGERDYSNLKK